MEIFGGLINPSAGSFFWHLMYFLAGCYIDFAAAIDIRTYIYIYICIYV